MGRNSDVDLVVKGGTFDAGRLLGDIHVNLHGVGQAVDVILALLGVGIFGVATIGWWHLLEAMK